MAEYTSAKEAVRDRARLTRLKKSQNTAETIKEREGSERARQSTASLKSTLKQNEIDRAARARISTQEEIASNRQGQRIENAALFGAANSSIGMSVGMIVALFFVMILIYVVVRNGKNFGTLMGSAGSFITGLSSNSALFIKNPGLI